MMFLTRLPIAYNDGALVPKLEMEKIKTKAYLIFGGFTLTGPDEGAWLDDRTGQVHQEMSYGLEVVIEQDQVDEARQFVHWAGQTLRQKEMILIFRDDPVEFLDTRE